MDLKKLLKAKDAAIPAKGFNVVEIDSHGRPGEDLTVVDHCATRPEAEKAAKKYEKDNPGVSAVVYGPDDR